MSITLRRALAWTIILLGVLLLPRTAPGQDSDWVGRKVMPGRPGVRLTHTDPASGNQVQLGELTDLVYSVRGEQDGWLHLRHRGAEGWVWKGEVVLFEDGVDYFAQQIRMNRNDAFALAHRGRAWQAEGEPERALRDLGDALRLQQNPNWFRARAAVYDELDETDRALLDLGDAIRLDPKAALNYTQRAVLYKSLREYDKAIADYSSAIRLDPASSAAFFNRGNAYKSKKDYAKAIADYSEALRLEPDFASALFNRGNAHKAHKDYSQAARDFSDLIRRDPRDADAYSSLAWLLATCPDAAVRDGNKAVEHAAKACEWTSWKAPYFLAVLAAACAEAGKFDQAVQWQKRALESPRYEKDEGDDARKRLKLFEERKPYREE
jgi:tetratricopeptide (TPR) repeat protein